MARRKAPLRTKWKVGDVWFREVRGRKEVRVDAPSRNRKRLRVTITEVGDGYVIEEAWERWARTPPYYEDVEDAAGRPTWGLAILPPYGRGWTDVTRQSEIGCSWRRRRDWEV